MHVKSPEVLSNLLATRLVIDIIQRHIAGQNTGPDGITRCGLFLQSRQPAPTVLADGAIRPVGKHVGNVRFPFDHSGVECRATDFNSQSQLVTTIITTEKQVFHEFFVTTGLFGLQKNNVIAEQRKSSGRMIQPGYCRVRRADDQCLAPPLGEPQVVPGGDRCGQWLVFERDTHDQPSHVLPQKTGHCEQVIRRGTWKVVQGLQFMNELLCIGTIDQRANMQLSVVGKLVDRTGRVLTDARSPDAIRFMIERPHAFAILQPLRELQKNLVRRQSCSGQLVFRNVMKVWFSHESRS